MDVRKSLERLVRTATKVLYIAEQMQTIGFSSSNYDDVAGDIADAIYHLIGEKTDTYEQSVTYRVLHEYTFLDETFRVSMLMDEYERNHTAMELC